METAKVVYLSRHPVPTAISTILRGWETYINTFLEDKKFVEQYLTKEAVDIMQTVEKEGSLLEKQVVNWCLENLVPLRSWKTKDWFSISYEHIISEPIQASRQICNRLGLSDPQKMSTVVSIPSQSASDSLKKSINKIDPRIRLEKWMSTVDPDTLNRIQSILDAFEIELYNVSSPYPLFSFRKDG